MQNPDIAQFNYDGPTNSDPGPDNYGAWTDDDFRRAADDVMAERTFVYNAPSVTFQLVASMWSALLGFQIKPSDAATMMLLLKVARFQGSRFSESASRDSIVDAINYAAIAGDLRESGL